MATLRFKSAKEMFIFVGIVVAGGVGLIAWRLSKGSLPTDGNALYWEAQKLERACSLRVEKAVAAVGPLDELQETATTPRDPVPALRPKFELPPSLSSGTACSLGLLLKDLEHATPAELEQVRGRVTSLQADPAMVLVTSGSSCVSGCVVTLAWVDVTNKQVLGVKKLQTTSVNRTSDVASWAASR